MNENSSPGLEERYGSSYRIFSAPKSTVDYTFLTKTLGFLRGRGAADNKRCSSWGFLQGHEKGDQIVWVWSESTSGVGQGFHIKESAVREPYSIQRRRARKTGFAGDIDATRAPEGKIVLYNQPTLGANGDAPGAGTKQFTGPKDPPDTWL
ncbi:unnamed protein product [Boreogadus saida]